MQLRSRYQCIIGVLFFFYQSMYRFKHNRNANVRRTHKRSPSLTPELIHTRAGQHWHQYIPQQDTRCISTPPSRTSPALMHPTVDTTCINISPNMTPLVLQWSTTGHQLRSCNPHQDTTYITASHSMTPPALIHANSNTSPALINSTTGH